jgi:hypothetical protein
MHITIRYENVPHFCFMCCMMGHAAMNCKEDDAGEHEIKYGEELHASPPRRVRELTVRQVPPRVAKPLFQAVPQEGHSSGRAQGKQDDWDARCRDGNHAEGGTRVYNIGSGPSAYTIVAGSSDKG